MSESNTIPIGTAQHFCSKCGAKVAIAQPEGDNKLRYVCNSCNTVHYENPKMVVGCVVGHEGKVLLCRRAIEPRYNCWTVPAGFMELNESVVAAAQRETYEEALAEVKVGGMLAVIDVVHAGQAHIFFYGTLLNGAYGIGEESLDTQLFLPQDIPWEEMAFPSGIIALQRYLHLQKTGDTSVHYAQAERMKRS